MSRRSRIGYLGRLTPAQLDAAGDTPMTHTPTLADILDAARDHGYDVDFDVDETFATIYLTAPHAVLVDIDEGRFVDADIVNFETGQTRHRFTTAAQLVDWLNR